MSEYSSETNFLSHVQENLNQQQQQEHEECAFQWKWNSDLLKINDTVLVQFAVLSSKSSYKYFVGQITELFLHDKQEKINFLGK